MNKKNFIITINIVFFVALTAGIGYYLFTKNTNPPTPNTEKNPVTAEPEQTQPTNPAKKEPEQTQVYVPGQEPKPEDMESDFLTISSPNNNVMVANFYKNPKTRFIDKQGDLRIYENFSYDITYFPSNQSFLISISDSDIWTTRTIAERNFLEILGITKERSCSLLVTVAISRFANENAAGIDYGLSFCPNGIPLPKKF
jgi:hypothetical protein